MANWLSLSNLKGIYISNPLSIPIRADGAMSKISWEEQVPKGSDIVVQTRVLIRNQWSEWKVCTNGSHIPDINEDTPLYDSKIYIRVIINSTSYDIVPVFKNIAIELEPVLVFDNIGDTHCKPEIWITMLDKGDFTMINTTHNNEDFTFTNLIRDETVYVNNDNENIISSLPVKYRYKDFNDNYLKVPVGKNVFRVKGKAQIQFRYQFHLLQ